MAQPATVAARHDVFAITEGAVLRVKFVATAALVLGLFVLEGGGSAWSEGNDKPQSSYAACLDSTATSAECDGLVCSCCNEIKDNGRKAGCWICSNKFDNCHWDPAYSTIKRNSSPGAILRKPAHP